MTGHSVWTIDGHVVMEDISAFKLVTMSLLQTSGYITKQMHAKVNIDVNKFLSAFSIETKDGHFRPPSWIPSEKDADAVDVTVDHSSSSSDSLTPIFSMSNYASCRRAEALRWIDLQEKRASIIPRLKPTALEDYQKLRDAVSAESGAQQRSDNKITGTLPNIAFDYLLTLQW